MQPFRTPLDICNRALVRVGAPILSSFSDDAKSAQLTGFVYKPLLQAELRRHPWRFATRRAVIRPVTSSSLRISPPPWSANAVVYSIGSLVSDINGNYWVCICPHTSSTNTSLQPGFPLSGLQDVFWKEWFGPIVGDQYNVNTNYFKGELVINGSDWYMSIPNNNVSQLLSNTTYWTHLTSASGIPAYYLNDIGEGVTVSGLAQHVYPLPDGYLRMTYAGVKAPSTAHNVVSAGLQFNDWQIEDDYLVSADAGPIHIRFIADIDAVLTFEPLFTEALAARIAVEVCESLTQSPQKYQLISAAYARFIDEAQQTNLIETGSVEPRDERFEDELTAASIPMMRAPVAAPGGR